MHLWLDGDSKEDIDEAINLYSPYKVKIEANRTHDFEEEYQSLVDKYDLDTDSTITWPPSLLIVHYGTSACFSQVSFRKYDLIVRARYDTEFVSRVPLEGYSRISHEFAIFPPAENCDKPFDKEMRELAKVSRFYLLNDQFAVGTPLMMQRYFSLYESIDDYLSKMHLDVGIFYHPEGLLKFHMNEAQGSFGEIIIDERIKMRLLREHL